MSLDALTGSAGALWIAAAVLLGIGEIVIPGVFLVFLAAAAAITGVATLALADLPVDAQLLSFAVWSVVAVLIGKRWYRDYPVESADPLLNDRAARLVGQTVIVTRAIVDGEGRVRVGDSSWPARGPDALAGAAVRVVGVESSVLLIEPLVTPSG